MDDERCPKCGSLFPAESAWARRTVGGVFGSWAFQDLDTTVRCPKCKLVFPAVAFRFYGVLSPRTMRLLAFSILLWVLFGSLYYGFTAS